jgi:hypothetical protein
MKLSDEQQEVVEYTGENLIVNACAGSGKSTTLLHYCLQKPKENKLLLCFNSSVSKEMTAKAKTMGVDNLKVSTAHSLAYRNFPNMKKYTLAQSLKPFDIMGAFNVRSNLANVMLYKSATDLFTLYCNSDRNKIKDIDYVNIMGMSDVYGDNEKRTEKKAFIKKNIDAISGTAQKIWDSMLEGKLPITHDFYLKHYQLSKPKLPFTTIVFDECLPYQTPILLGDGSSKPIGDIVENKLHVEVLAYNTETKKQEICKVLGWQKIPNTKKMVKVRALRRGAWRGNRTQDIVNFVVCTEDHKIWADGKWIAAKDITPGMVLQIETKAKKTNKYKISNVGKAVLSNEMKSGDKARRIGGTNRVTNRTPSFSGSKGGNGATLTEPQKFLLGLLNSDWVSEHCVSSMGVGKDPTYRYPKNYKIDLANPHLKIAIELDGSTHAGRRVVSDTMKQNYLEANGWKVYRYKNIEVFRNIDIILKEITTCTDGVHCPVDAKVISVEESSVNEYFVYDLTVEKCHNFYANGILVHNCQDAAPNMLDIFRRQDQAKKIGIGDENQAIYGWRGAVDALNMLDFPKKHLSRSFRFAQNIADIANEITKCRLLLDKNFKHTPMTGMDKPHINNNQTCFLARTNLRLLSKLIEYVDNGGVEFAFEGSINQSIFTQDGVSIYDIYALFAGKREYMKNDFIRAFGSWKEFLEYVELMEDFELKVLAGLVVKYRGGIFDMLKKVKATETSKKEAKIVFSSAHKSKGLEYGKVYLLDDFLQKKDFMDILKLKADIPEKQIGKTVSLESVNQELNLLYVAVTRTVNELFLSGEIPLFSSLPPSYSNRASLGKRI